MNGRPTATSGTEWAFAVPPNWPAPPGFDPREGHVPDPSWPAAPPGWQFWVPQPVGPAGHTGAPSGAHAAPEPASRSSRRTLAVLVVALGVVVAVFLGMNLLPVVTKAPPSPSEGVGSCWTGFGPASRSIDCANTAAHYKVVAVVADPRMCPSTVTTYVDMLVPGSPTRYGCLISH